MNRRSRSGSKGASCLGSSVLLSVFFCCFCVSPCYNNLIKLVFGVCLVLPSVSFSAVPSPVAVSAPSPSRVAFRAASFGASWLCVRPSARSFSGWVAVCLFSSSEAAGRFARFSAARLGLPFCAVRSSGFWFAVSVPCFVSAVPSVPAGSLPCVWFALGGGGSVPASPVPSPSPSPVAGVPAPVASALSSAAVLGFSGSRSVVPPVLGSVLLLAVGSSTPVFVGCARGVDAAVRSGLPASRVRVFRVSGLGRGAFAARSAAFVSALASAGGVLFSFPSAGCPSGLVPAASASRCFSGSGSGSWASLAFAVGLGVPAFVWLPAGVVPPAAWGFVSLGGGWWSLSPSVVQLSLL